MSQPSVPVESPPLRYFGGKWMLAPWIIEQFPTHKVYCESFGGGGSVLLRKPRSYAEIYNDMDREIVNVFKQLRDNGPELERRLSLTPWAREDYDESYEPSDDPIEQARRTIFRSAAGFADATTRKSKCGFRAVMSQGKAAASVWRDYPDKIEAFTERLRGVVIENGPAIEVMARHDSLETLHFVDPPYVHSTRTTLDAYRYEMTDAQHEELCAFLKTLKGMVILCGYESEIYEALGWELRKREALADGAKERVECLWLNPGAVAAQDQPRMF